MVTAETLTDEEIREVYIAAVGPGSHQQADPDLMHACTVARNAYGDFTADEQADARRTVAAAINARKGTSNTPLPASMHEPDCEYVPMLRPCSCSTSRH